jgi:hypothetical protein
MKLNIIEKITEDRGEGLYKYTLSYFRIKFLGEIFELTKNNISLIQMIQFYLERKASRRCVEYFRNYPHSFKKKIVMYFWSKLEWYWRKIYNKHRRITEDNIIKERNL